MSEQATEGAKAPAKKKYIRAGLAPQNTASSLSTSQIINEPAAELPSEAKDKTPEAVKNNTSTPIIDNDAHYFTASNVTADVAVTKNVDTNSHLPPPPPIETEIDKLTLKDTVQTDAPSASVTEPVIPTVTKTDLKIELNQHPSIREVLLDIPVQSPSKIIKPPSSPITLKECSICSDHVQSDNGCNCSKSHFLCFCCLDCYIANAVDTNDEKYWDDKHNMKCPVDGCIVSYNLQYLAYRNKLPDRAFSGLCKLKQMSRTREAEVEVIEAQSGRWNPPKGH